eukprot:CAMPEP_0119528178 /NCGR_PEP_ID=MMETSP1344-20130328/42440_1 /TAXON_ID=236787 /ORGANISM="Florenciella parvula, Strain CCMP2471" /LENGTH=142 /DNA_ID=CAMNT_0007567527 /DNA_START=550 /DNA_END=976 /DNA_ORIENTATION=-
MPRAAATSPPRPLAPGIGMDWAVLRGGEEGSAGACTSAFEKVGLAPEPAEAASVECGAESASGASCSATESVARAVGADVVDPVVGAACSSAAAAGAGAAGAGAAVAGAGAGACGAGAGAAGAGAGAGAAAGAGAGAAAAAA